MEELEGREKFFFCKRLFQNVFILDIDLVLCIHSIKLFSDFSPQFLSEKRNLFTSVLKHNSLFFCFRNKICFVVFFSNTGSIKVYPCK